MPSPGSMERVAQCIDHGSRDTFSRCLSEPKPHTRFSGMTHGTKYPVGVDTSADVLNYAKSPTREIISQARERFHNRAPLGASKHAGTLPARFADSAFGVQTVLGEGVSALIKLDPALKTGDTDTRPLAYTDFVKKEFPLSSGRLGSDGKRIQESMLWPERGVKIVDKRLEAFKERTHRQIGKVHDPLRETMGHVPGSFVFGLKLPEDEHCVAQLVHPYLSEQNTGRQQSTQQHAELTEKVNNKPFDATQPAYPAFGSPTVLKGTKPKYYVKSLADSNNYGNEPNVSELLSPLILHQRDREWLADYYTETRDAPAPFLPPAGRGRRSGQRGLVKTSPFAMTVQEARIRKLRPLGSGALKLPAVKV